MSTRHVFGAFSLPVADQTYAHLYTLTKDISVTDETKLAEITSPVNTDVAVINTTVTKDTVTTIVQKTAYWYNGSNWVALNGVTSADQVLLTEDITLAGNYTQVGNVTKALTGTATLNAKGRTLSALLNDIFYKKLQPVIERSPSLETPAISRAGGLDVEVGTVLNGVNVAAAVFDPGAYTYGPATGITPTYTVDRYVDGTYDAAVSGVAADGSVTDNAGVTIGDQSGDSNSITYKVTATYGAGATAVDNLGGASNPEVKIAAGSISAESTLAVTGYRQGFYGAANSVPGTVDSAYIRGLNGTARALAAGDEIVLTAAAGSKFVAFAIPASLSLSAIIDESAMNANLLSVFDVETVSVAGANDYTAISYKVYTYKPDVALGAIKYVAKI